ncbi:MAG: DUF1178 family protein [Betaproteobacteria bacterium]|nr:DUF1178 family protein [Burkholderiales bacterium]MCE2644200.1 DUF1178 family protein [Burkholderiaceae bacterium]
MKVFNLRCDNAHTFEGWFASGNDLDAQRERGLLSCPVCNSVEVVKAPSAPYVGRAVAEPAPAETGAAARQTAIMPTPAQMQAMFMTMAREIARTTEDVGERFAEEARRIHYNEVPARGIRGTTTRAEAQALDEEGIGVMPIPFAHLLNDLQ